MPYAWLGAGVFTVSMGAAVTAGVGLAEADDGRSPDGSSARPASAGPRISRLPGARPPAVRSTTVPFAPAVTYDPGRNVTDGGVVSGRLDIAAAGVFALAGSAGPAHVSSGASPRWLRGPRINAQPAHGSLDVDPDGTFTYIPDPELGRTGGSDTFTVMVSDFLGRSTFVPVSVAVSANGGYSAAVNTAGSAGGVVLGEVLGGGDGQGITYSADPGPEKGSVQVDAATGLFTYTPSMSARHRAAANGATAADLTDSFSIMVSGGRAGSFHVPVSVALEPYNADPEMTLTPGRPDLATGAVTVGIGGRDDDGDELSFSVTCGPVFGSVTPTAAGPLPGGDVVVFSYVPTEAARRASARGGPSTDRFTVTVDDGHGGVVSAVVSVNIAALNADPTSVIAVNPPGLSGAVDGVIAGSDSDGDVLTYNLTNGPAYGTASVNPATGAFVYTPTAVARHGASRGGPGIDRFTVRVSDGFGGSVDVPVAVTIGPSNTAPAASFVAGSPDVTSGAVAGGVNASDNDGDALAYNLIAGPAYGTASVNLATGAWVYTPSVSGRHGAAGLGPSVDGFTVRVSDGHGGSVDVPVAVTIGPSNAAPVASCVVGSPDVTSGVVTGTLTATDADGDTLAYTVSSGPASGSVSVDAVTGALVYTPTAVARHGAAGAGPGVDAFVVRVSDGFGGSVDVPVAVTIGPSNAVPVGSLVVGAPDVNSGLVTGTLTATDADGDILAYTVSSGPAGGSVAVNAVSGAFAYTPTAIARQGAAGTGPVTDSFTVVITDGHGGSVNQIVAVAIAPVLGCVGCAFVASTASNTVAAIDTDTNTVIATVSVGSSPFGVAVNPAGTRVYVSNDGTNTVSVIDAVTNTLVTTITVGSNARGIAVTPDGSRVYVTNRGSNTVSVINTATNTVIATVPVGSYPNWVAVSPDGTRAYVNNYFSNSVSVIDVATNTVTASISVGGNPFGLAFNPAGTLAYVANQGGGVSVIDTSTNTRIATITVGSGPYAVAFNPAGTRAYVSNHFAGTVSVIDTASNAVTATVSVGSNPAGLGVSPDGSRLYVAVGGNPSAVKVIDTATNTILSSFSIANGPSILAMSPL